MFGCHENASSGQADTKHTVNILSSTRTLDALSPLSTMTSGVHSLVKPPSPLCCLQRWHEQGARVRVVTRHATGVRGVAEGELMAYDLYMNLVLRDVTERYTVLIKVGGTRCCTSAVRSRETLRLQKQPEASLRLGSPKSCMSLH
jgi:small nuclear ribonucleoprotein (snRNP)-like protein